MCKSLIPKTLKKKKRLNTVKISILPKLIYKSTQSQSKSQESFFVETEKLILKCMWKCKAAGIEFFLERDRARKLIVPTVKAFIKLQESRQHIWHTHKHMQQQNRIET